MMENILNGLQAGTISDRAAAIEKLSRRLAQGKPLQEKPQNLSTHFQVTSDYKATFIKVSKCREAEGKSLKSGVPQGLHNATCSNRRVPFLG